MRTFTYITYIKFRGADFQNVRGGLVTSSFAPSRKTLAKSIDCDGYL